MNKIFTTILSDNIKDIGFIGPYLYLKPANHILSGFCAEETPNGIYISKYIYPLFDRSDTLNLNFSERLPYPAGYISFNEHGYEDCALEFLERITPYIGVARKHLSIEAFYTYLLDHEAILNNEWVRKSYLLLLVVLEKYSEAQAEAELILRKRYTGTREQITREAEEFKELLASDPPRARALVLTWENAMKARLGIQ